MLHGGLGNLAAYLAAHVLLCLLPAFFIAGAMAALIPTEIITRFLGRNSSKTVSYPAAAAAGSLLAVCSCTIVPLFAGIYRKGAASVYDYLGFAYTGSRIDGTLSFPADELYEELAPGDYEARLMFDDHYRVMAVAPFTVAAP